MRKERLGSLSLFVGLAACFLCFSASASQTSTSLEACEDKIQQDLTNYEQMMCMYRLSTRGPQAWSAAHGRLKQLDQAHPGNLRLKIIQAHLFRNREPDTAIRLYQEIANRAELRNELDVQVIALINLGDLLLVQQRDAQAVEALRMASDLGQASPSAITRMRAHLVQVYHAVRLSLDLGTVHEKLFAMGRDELASLPYSLQRLALFARVQAATELLAAGPALEDIAYLRELAQDHGDGGDAFTIALADYLKGTTLYEQLSVLSNAQLRHEAIQALLSARKAFSTQGQTINEINTIFTLADLSQGEDQLDTSAWAKRCEDLLDTDLPPSSRVLCLLALSQISRSSDPAQALAYARQGHALCGDSTKVWERIVAWRQVMRRSWDPDHLERSRLIAKAGLQVMEDIRRLQTQPIARRQVFARWVVDYHWYISKLLENQEKTPELLQEAFWIAERARARVLWDELNKHEDRSLGRGWQDIKPSDQERLLRQHLSGVLDSKTPDPRTFHAFQDAVAKGWQGDDQPRFVRAQEVQAQLLPHQAMVTFQVGPAHAHDGEPLSQASAFVLTQNRLNALSFDWDEHAINSASGILRAFTERGSPEQVAIADQIREMVLHPLRAELPDTITELIIVAQGKLQELPWFILDDRYSYSFVPSATIWVHLQKAHASTFSLKGVAFVDPTPSEHSASVERALSCDEDRLTPKQAQERPPVFRALPHSRRELEAIAANAGDQVRGFFGAQSSLSNLSKRWTPQDRFLHVSAHSVISPRCPERSGILLAADAGHPNGLISLQEISTLDLEGAVVVLGGCSTALGQNVAGEGVLSIARAFQQAGAQAVVASLWPLRDKEAADFMEALYPAMRNAPTLSAAVRQAQQELRAQGQSMQAYAGYVVLGNGSVRPVGPWKTRPGLSGWMWLALLPAVSILFYGIRGIQKKR